MYLYDELVDAVPLGQVELRAGCGTHINRLKEALLKKHKAVLLEAETKPTFVLGGVPSCINDFVPSSHHCS